MTKLAWIVIAALAAGPATAAPLVLTSDGYGPIRIGMTPAKVTAKMGAGFALDPGASDGACQQASVKRYPGMSLMFQSGRLTRISLLTGSRIADGRGVKVGDPEAKVRRLYGTVLKVEPHKYEAPPAAYLTAIEARTGRGIKFSTSEKRKVEQIDAGEAGAIALVEGCL